MKLAKFKELCARYWADGKGDLSALYLSEESFSELYEDILLNRADRISIVHPHWHIVNPITRTEVRMQTWDEPKDQALIHYMGRRSLKVNVE